MSVRPTLQLWPFCFAFQVLAGELNAVKRRRAEKRAEQRVLAQQEKILKQRRMRILQVALYGRQQHVALNHLILL